MPSEAEILDAALDLLDAGGPKAVTIRGAAAAIGAAPHAVYTYFADKAALERALLERLLDLPEKITGADDWRSEVEQLALELRRRLAAHPGAVPLLIGGPLDGPGPWRFGERLLTLLTEGGLDPAAAARGSYAVMVFVLGSIALEVADVPGAGALPPETERVDARRAALSEVPAGTYPRTAAAAGVMATWVGTEQFRWGLQRLLDGLALHP
ncbi:TetR/AcrR family transcriptional regulator C-terminal domain-containing protein [Paractinoplanes atraurantiacus]|uniref:Regulatory protein, tetR family n=1 Tax=Paractinoplanes atraurantiacus TaxID=1036182 RepID=A0A285HZZ5_9ACTN|nr:TetR/AcrR family transcriptional regulator C-terminal domain-containing protein [Actinoplanes atraurantiacus]SNY41302.1 regulatory protein, tetR family [Actinoplanes atraurantiacus]